MAQSHAVKAKSLDLIAHAYGNFGPSDQLDEYVSQLGKIRFDNDYQGTWYKSLSIMLARIGERDYIYDLEAATPGAVAVHKAWMAIVEEHHLVPTKKDPTLSVKKLGAEALTLSGAINTCVETYLSGVDFGVRIKIKAQLHQVMVELMNDYTVKPGVASMEALVAAMAVWVNIPEYRLAQHAELSPVYDAYAKLVARRNAKNTGS